VESICWVDGRLRSIREARAGADDSAREHERGCYTTARVRAGEIHLETRHVERLVRDARALALGEVDADLARRGLRELAEAAFGSGDGIVRLQASRDAGGDVRLVGTARALGDDPPEWAAICAAQRHDGGGVPGGPKRTHRPLLSQAAEAARQAGAQEALLFDAEGRLVEGARTNVVVATERGDLFTPPLARGGVAGIARAIALERVPELREGDIAADALFGAAEIVVVNAVRGARAIATLDGRRIGGPRRPFCARLTAALERG
jgi:branched-subunit amino acid aminotransferase/4-amino-4-deoxychorismate lyase